MTHLQNTNEYYRRMLELQERLRKSEEERKRLEERFSLLEHESRSRHETCINRLRMRYIEFLEEQQARDERNHELLGALARVDTSLAIMSAKTERLEALRKQYEASIHAPRENRRANSSVAGDSGVASQNDERQRKWDAPMTASNEENVSSCARGTTTAVNRRLGTERNSRLCESPSHARRGSFAAFASNWPIARRESFDTCQRSQGFSLFRQNGEKSFPMPREEEYASQGSQRVSSYRITGEKSVSMIGNRFIMASPSTRDLRLSREVPSSYRRTDALPIARRLYSPIDDRRSALEHIDSNPPATGDSYHSANSLDNDLKIISHGNFILSTDRAAIVNKRDGSPRSPRLSEILRRELDDEEEQDDETREESDEYAGGIVEHQLERYISKIRSLHREAEPSRSIEEIEDNNTSGDLLNVTLSEDALVASNEARHSDDTLPPEIGNVLALAEDLAVRTAARVDSVANSVLHGVCENRENRPRETIIASEIIHRSTPIDPAADDEKSPDSMRRDACAPKKSLAKNGISPLLEKSMAELAMGSSQDIQDVARTALNREMGRESAGEAKKLVESSRIFSSLDRAMESSGSLVNGRECVNGENFEEELEDLEPWNLSALERRVQEIILNDEAQNDFARGRRDRVTESAEIGDVGNGSGMEQSGMESVNGNREVRRIVREGKPSSEPGSDSATRKGEFLHDDRENTRDKNREAENDSKTERCGDGVENLADELYADRNEYYDDPNVPYEYGAAGGYEVDPNERYEEYETIGNTAYDDFQGEGYEYAGDSGDRSHDRQDYVLESTDRGEYPDDSREYVQDPGDVDYARDTDQGYEDVVGNEGYGADLADRQYVAVPNDEQYCADLANRQYETGPNDEQYSADLADRQYEAGISDQYTTDHADRQYEAGISDQYATDHADRQYEATNSDQYTTDHADRQYETANSDQYTTDHADGQCEAANSDQYTTEHADQQYEGGISDQYTTDHVDQQYEAAIGHEYATDLDDRQYETAANEQYNTDSVDHRYDTFSNEQYNTDLTDRHHETGPTNEQYSADYKNEKYITDPADITDHGDSDQPYVADFKDPYPENVGPHCPYDPSKNYPLDRQYHPDEANAKVENAEYPSTSAENEDHEVSNPDRESVENVQALEAADANEPKISPNEDIRAKKKDAIRSILDSDTESTIERNVSNAESDFDFN